ncbi:MAG: glycosyltransferase family 4 protein [Desulfobacterales bacterium]|jgi:glycosyltransferase involved in cell wall biosynthesis
MRLLFVITELDEGGAEQVFERVVRAAGKEHDVGVVCLFHKHGSVGQRIQKNGMSVKELGITGFSTLHRARRLSRIIVSFQPDLIHSWLFHANVITRTMAPRGIPVISSLRVVEPRRSHLWLERLTRKRCSRFLCVSQAVANLAISRIGVSPNKCLVIENGVDSEQFISARRPRKLQKKVKGLTVARIAHQKGIDILLHALAMLPDTIDWKWHFIGHTPEITYARELKQFSVDAGIEKRIVWHGGVDRTGLLQFYHDADIFALPSRWEGQANVLLESAAAGLPALRTEYAGFTKDCPFVIVSPHTPSQWAQAIAELCASEEKYEIIANRAVAWAESRSWKPLLAKYLQLYTQFDSSG